MPAQLPDLWLRAALLRGAPVRHEPSHSLPGYSFNEVSPSTESHRLVSFISLGHCMNSVHMRGRSMAYVHSPYGCLAHIFVCCECTNNCARAWRLLIQLQLDQEKDARLSR